MNDPSAKAAAARALSQSQQDYFRHLAHRRVLPRPPGANALFLAPHPDDIVLGCGGTAQLYRDDGARVRFAYLTDGRGATEDAAAQQAMATRRASEARAVAERLRIEPPHFFDFDETRFALPESEAAQLDALCAYLAADPPDVVFAPYLWDQHADHRYTNHLLARALERTGIAADVYGYEVWSFAPPGVVVDVTGVFEEKLAVLALYESQLELFDYLGFTQQVAHFHAPLGPEGARFCEVFCPFRADAYIATVKELDLASPTSRETIVLLTPPETMPA